MDRFAVVGCSTCKQAWAVEARHGTTTCPGCRGSRPAKRRRALWSGDSAVDAQKATAAIRAALAQGLPVDQAAAAAQALRPVDALPKHDNVLDAAAAKARGLRNASDRAEAVMLWLGRLAGPLPENDVLEALGKAGLGHDRAEKEIVRMLAGDVIYEPRAGYYEVLPG